MHLCTYVECSCFEVASKQKTENKKNNEFGAPINYEVDSCNSGVRAKRRMTMMVVIPLLVKKQNNNKNNKKKLKITTKSHIKSKI